MFAYHISHLKGFLCAASGMLISLNDVIMLACNLEKDDKVVRNACAAHKYSKHNQSSLLLNLMVNTGKLQFILMIAHQGLSTV